MVNLFVKGELFSENSARVLIHSALHVAILPFFALPWRSTVVPETD